MKENTENIICVCGKIFVNKYTLKRHKNICKTIINNNNITYSSFIEELNLKNSKLISNEKDIEYMKKEIEELKIRNTKQEEKYEREIASLKSKYEREIDDYKRQINNYLNKEASRVDSSLGRPTNVVNNTNINTIINNYIKPIDISLDRFNTIVDRDYSIGLCNDKEKGVVEILKTFFSNEFGALQAICSDRNRGWIVTVDSESNQVYHTFDSIKNMIGESSVLKDKIAIYAQHYLRDEYIGQENADELGLARSIETQQLFRDNFKTSYDMFKVLCFNHYNALKRQRLEEATSQQRI